MILDEQYQKTLNTINDFLATDLMGFLIHEDYQERWYDPESQIYLYARGQSCMFEENWAPAYVLDQAMRCFNKLNLSANITFDAEDEGDWRYVVEIKADHSIGNGNTLAIALTTACAEYKRWRQLTS